MKYVNFAIVISFFSICFIGRALAQDVNISGEIRPRFEYRKGYKTLMSDTEEPASFISQRTRLNASYGDKLFRSKLVLQNVRVWGDVAQLNSSDINGIAIHEAWGEVLFSDKLSLKVGRQEIVYDDQRIFGSVGWAQQARSHDAAIIKYTLSGKHLFDIGIAYNASSESLYKTDYELDSYKSFQYLYYMGKLTSIDLSFLVLNNGMAYMKETITGTTQEIAYSQTMGSRVSYNGNEFSANASFYVQSGKNKSNKSLSALYLIANLNYNITGKFNIGLGTEYLSGTSSKNQENPNKNDRSFKPYYGTNHKFNGWMDYFYVGSYMYSNGLIDIYVPLTLKVKKLTFKLIPHNFMASAKVADLQTDGTWKDHNNGLGQEIDFTVQYPISKSMNISAGYSQMFATESMRVLKGGNSENTNNWAWLMFTFNPIFFQTD